MNIAIIVFGLIIATLMGALFHLWKGGNLGRLLLYLIFAWIGFFAGHMLGGALGWDFASVGGLRLGPALLIGAVALFVGHWLSLIQREEPR